MLKGPKADEEQIELVGETLADVLDLGTWGTSGPARVVREAAGRVSLAPGAPPEITPEQEAERRAALEAWERGVRENPPERIAQALGRPGAPAAGMAGAAPERLPGAPAPPCPPEAHRRAAARAAGRRPTRITRHSRLNSPTTTTT